MYQRTRRTKFTCWQYQPVTIYQNQIYRNNLFLSNKMWEPGGGAKKPLIRTL